MVMSKHIQDDEMFDEVKGASGKKRASSLVLNKKDWDSFEVEMFMCNYE